MHMKDLVVVLDGSARSETRLAIAVELARRNDAHLTGLCPLELLLPASLGFALAGYPEVLALQNAVDELQGKASDQAARIEAVFRDTLRRNDLAGDWQVSPGPVGQVVAVRARHADLTVMGQVDPDAKQPPAARRLVEDVLMASGRPVLVIPFAGRFETIGTNVLIGWNDTREAARAANDALMVIDPSAKVTVLSVQRAEPSREPPEVPGAEIADHLARHGLNVSAARTVTDGTISDADALLDYAADTGADLLVVGGYGHSRAREVALGGVTRSLLRTMTVPVLMAH